MGDINQAMLDAIEIANNPLHGYSQLDRDGDPDYDCSSLMIRCLRKNGFKLAGAVTTRDMAPAMIREGFINVISSCDMATGKGLKVGDVLLTPGHHTAMYIGNGKIVHAVGDEKGGHGEGAKPGDQTGKEITIAKYYNRPGGWMYVFRLPSVTPDECPYPEPTEVHTPKTWFSGDDAYWFQWQLHRIGHDIKVDGKAYDVTWSRMCCEMKQADMMGHPTGNLAGKVFRDYLKLCKSKNK